MMAGPDGRRPAREKQVSSDDNCASPDVEGIERGRFLGEYLPLGAILACSALLHMPLAVMPLWRDQAQWLAITMALLDGRVLYVDVAPSNLLGTAFAYAAGLGLVSDPAAAIALTHFGATAAVSIFAYLLIRDAFDRLAAIVGVGLFATMWPMLAVWGTIAQRDFLCLWCVVAATWAAMAGNWKRGVVAGLFVAGAAMFKTLYGGIGFVLVAMLLVRGEWRRALALCLGVAIAFAPLLLYLAWFGALDDAYLNVVEMALAHSGTKRVPATGVLSRMLIGLMFRQGLVVCCLALVAIVRLARGPGTTWWLIAPPLTTIGAAMAQGRGVLYHLEPTWALVVMLAGIGATWLVSMPGMAPRLVSVAIAASIGHLFVVRANLPADVDQPYAFGYGQWGRHLTHALGGMSRDAYLSYYPSDSDNFPHPSVHQEAADWIREHSDTEESIVVWGAEPQLYVLSGRTMASQYPTSHPFVPLNDEGTLTPLQEQQRATLLSLMHAHRPAVVAVPNIDHWYSGNAEETLEQWTELSEWLHDNYRLEHEVERLKLYLRNDKPN